MNAEIPRSPQDDFEPKLTALLLGELPNEEAEALRAVISKNPELASLHNRLKLSIGLLRQTVTDPVKQAGPQPAPLKLAEERRAKLLQHFKTIAPNEFARPQRRTLHWALPMSIAAAFVLSIGVALFWEELGPRHPYAEASVPATSHALDEVRQKTESLSGLPKAGVYLQEKGVANEPEALAKAKPPSQAPGRTVAFNNRVSSLDANGSIFLPATPQVSDIAVVPALNETAHQAGYTVPANRRGFSADGALASSKDKAGTEPSGNTITVPESAETWPPPDSRELFMKRYGLASSPLQRLEEPKVQPQVPSSAPQVTTADAFVVSNPTAQPNGELADGLTGGRDQLAYSIGKEKLAEIMRRSDVSLGFTPSQRPAQAKDTADLPTLGVPYPTGFNKFDNADNITILNTVQNAEPPILLGRVITNLAFADFENDGKREFFANGTKSSVRDLSLNPGDNGQTAQQLGVAKFPESFGDSAANAQTMFYSTEIASAGENSGRVLSGLHISNTPIEARNYAIMPPSSLVLNNGTQLESMRGVVVAGSAIQSTKKVLEEGKLGARTDSEKEEKAGKDVRDAERALGEKRGEVVSEASKAQVGRDETKKQLVDAALARPPAGAPIPQPEILTRDNAFSTFSLNVSDVSFKLAAASLEKGQMPDPANIRSEEFINAFDYHDPEASPGVPVAFAWERSHYPFAQNRDLLRFSLKTAALGRQPGRPLNLVLLLDNSGSMERADRVSIIREALKVLAGQLQPQDKFSIVTFARTARLVVDGVTGDQAGQAADEVGKLPPQGGTNLEEALNLAYQTALRHYLAEGVNRVVLLTDGAANLGDVAAESLKQKVETHRKQGVALDCFGIGWEGYDDDLLEVLTRNGDGRYGFINSPQEAAEGFASQLSGALHVAASDVKVQVEFNPARVTTYRQLGYAKHQLTKEQFRDNTVDAAEIGAAESGNALYLVEVNPAGTGPLATVRIRYKVPGTATYREQEWAVPFTGNAAPLEQASPAMRLAATAGAFAEWLASSPFAGEVTLDRLLSSLNGVPEIYGADPRPKKLEWMLRQAKSIGGK